ncbi:MAG: hypothetical protein K2O03_04910, partial [Lachnospiraceae bacterium]|nr:hypothetical protein [Lachnospiraceae bacterium]
GKEADQSNLWANLQELNVKAKEYPELKLLIYDEGQEISEEMDVFLRILSGKKVADGNGNWMAGTFPSQLLYIQGKKKEYVPLKETSSFFHMDGEGRFGENVRMLWMDMESENERKKCFSEFKLCCALLSLAVGQIPYTFMEAGYRYDLDIEIDEEMFGRYVSILDERLEQIQACCERERENLKQRMRNKQAFPDVEFQKICFEEEGQGQDGRKDIKILTLWEMLGRDDIDDVLRQNRELLMEQMFYPKGLLREASQNIRKTVEDMKGTENFLDEVAEELLQKQIGETINEICLQKDAQLEQQRFEEGICRTEGMVREQAARMMEKKKCLLVLFFAGILELFVTEPYLIRYVLAERGYGWWLWLWFGLTALGTMIFVCLGYYVYLLVLHKKCWGTYKKKICGKLSEYRHNKKIYLENILFLTLKYQYYEKIKREQKQFHKKWNEEREMLVFHVRMLENGKQGLGSLLY